VTGKREPVNWEKNAGAAANAQCAEGKIKKRRGRGDKEGGQGWEGDGQTIIWKPRTDQARETAEDWGARTMKGA